MANSTFGAPAGSRGFRPFGIDSRNWEQFSGFRVGRLRPGDPLRSLASERRRPRRQLISWHSWCAENGFDVNGAYYEVFRGLVPALPPLSEDWSVRNTAFRSPPWAHTWATWQRSGKCWPRTGSRRRMVSSPRPSWRALAERTDVCSALTAAGCGAHADKRLGDVPYHQLRKYPAHPDNRLRLPGAGLTPFGGLATCSAGETRAIGG